MARGLNSRTRTQWAGADADETLQRAEGLLQHLRDTKPEFRPDMTTVMYLARHYETSIQAMTWRIRDAEARRARDDMADNWLDVIYRIGNELGETLLAKTFAIAKDTTNRNSFNAQKFLLAKIDPEVYGDAPQAKPQGHDSSLVADVPQEVWDELQDDEREQLEEIEQTVAQAMVKLEHLVRRAQKRVADRRVSEVENGPE